MEVKCPFKDYACHELCPLWIMHGGCSFRLMAYKFLEIDTRLLCISNSIDALKTKKEEND